MFLMKIPFESCLKEWTDKIEVTCNIAVNSISILMFFFTLISHLPELNIRYLLFLDTWPCSLFLDKMFSCTILTFKNLMQNINNFQKEQAMVSHKRRFISVGGYIFHGSYAVLKALNFKIGFEDFEKVLNVHGQNVH